MRGFETGLPEMVRRIAIVFMAVVGMTMAPVPSSGAADEGVADRIAKADQKFLKALGDLAKGYDSEKNKNPEAAHFFAECAVGFGSKEPGIAAIKGGVEIDVYVGKLRGGKALEEIGSIRTILRPSQAEYKKLFDELLASARSGPVAEGVRKALYDCAVKYEIARGAADYLVALQKFNELRRAMGLRGLLWDFDASKKLILAACYMGDTGDYRSKQQVGNKAEDNSQKDNIFWSSAVEFAKEKSSRVLHPDLATVADLIRSAALVREDILNLDARRLWLGRWSEGRRIPVIVQYAIPPIDYRSDIPTPSKRYERETVTQDLKGWVDTEDSISVVGKKIPFVRYPYEGESNAPLRFVDEYGWAESEKDFLARAGLPIMIRFFSDCALTDVGMTLKDAGGKSVACRVYRDGDKRVQFHVRFPTILLMPERALERGAKYTVAVSCKLDGTTFEKSWSFVTRSQ